MPNLIVAAAESVTPFLTPEMLKPLTDGINANLGILVPIGFTIFAVILVISMAPRFIKKFTH